MTHNLHLCINPNARAPTVKTQRPWNIIKTKFLCFINKSAIYSGRAVVSFVKNRIAKTYFIQAVEGTCACFPHLLSDFGKIRCNPSAHTAQPTEIRTLFWGTNKFLSIFIAHFLTFSSLGAIAP